jgi:CubicO group peptidase (beta-lactamase class C family)
VTAVKRGPAPSSPPGAKQAYSNVGYLALGVVIAAVSGVSVSEAIRTRIMEPCT